MTDQTKKIMPPVARHRLDRLGMVRLEFPDGSLALTGPYRVLGGISAPGEAGRGCAILAAIHAQSGAVYLQEQAEFEVVSPVLDGGRLQPYPALAPLLGRWLLDYFASTYYLYEPHYAREIQGCPALTAEPELLAARWPSEGAPLDFLARLGAAGQLMGAQGSPFDRAAGLHEADPALIPPPLRAVIALAWGAWLLAQERQEKRPPGAGKWIVRPERASIRGFD